MYLEQHMLEAFIEIFETVKYRHAQTRILKRLRAQITHQNNDTATNLN